MTKMTIKFTKIGPGAKASPKVTKKAAPGAVAGFSLLVGDKEPFTIYGLDTNGNEVDISGEATLTITSSNPALLSVDTPVGMTSTMHAIMPSPPPKAGADLGTVTLTPVVTFNPPSTQAPITITAQVDCQVGQAGNIVLVPGQATVGP